MKSLVCKILQFIIIQNNKCVKIKLSEYIALYI